MSQSYYSHLLLSQEGGGFMNQASQNGTSPSSTKKFDLYQSTRPVTLSQIKQATQSNSDANYFVMGHEVGHVTSVAHVVDIRDSAGGKVYKTYTLQDGTATMEARFWDGGGHADEDSEVHNKYARITGIIKTFSQRRYLNAISVRLIKDPNELIFHFLDTVSSHLIAEHDGVIPIAGTLPIKSEMPQTSAYTRRNLSTRGPYDHRDPLERQIIQVLKDGKQSEGVELVELVNIISATGLVKFPADADIASMIGDTIETLMDDGLVHTTIDDMHFVLNE